MPDTRDWRLIAAEMLDKKAFSIGGDTDPNGPEMRAASFIFDQGVFYLGHAGMKQVAEMLRAKATKEAKA